jgi:hypothetical protein
MVGLLTWEGSQALALVNQNVDRKQEINKLSQAFDSVRNVKHDRPLASAQHRRVMAANTRDFPHFISTTQVSRRLAYPSIVRPEAANAQEWTSVKEQ